MTAWLGISLAGCDAPAPEPAALPARQILAKASEMAQRHRVAEALAWIESQRAADSSPVADVRRLSVERARLLVRMSRPDEAVEILNAWSPLRPAEARLAVRAHLDAGSAAAALESLGTLGPPDHPALIELYAEAELGTGSHGDAATSFALLLSAQPWDDRHYRLAGQALVRAGRRDVGRAVLDRFRESGGYQAEEQHALRFEFDGQDARAAIVRGRVARTRGRLYAAMVQFNRARQLDPTEGVALLELAEISTFLGRPGDAIEQLEKLPRDPRLVEVLAAAYVESGRADRATRLYAEAGLTDPAPPDDSSSDPEVAARRELGRRMEHRPLSECVPELIELAALLASTDREDDARAVALFTARLAPKNPAARGAVLEHFDRPGDVYFRLWALREGAEPDRETSELEALGVDPAGYRERRERARTIEAGLTRRSAAAAGR